jgi:hypothetical protein
MNKKEFYSSYSKHRKHSKGRIYFTYISCSRSILLEYIYLKPIKHNLKERLGYFKRSKQKNKPYINDCYYYA